MASDKLKIQKQVNIKNKKASFEYYLLDKYVCGIVLKGSEIKSIRLGKASLQEAYCYLNNGELFIKGMHISPFEKGGDANNHDPIAERKLLLKKKELKKIEGKLKDVGMTIIPIRLFISERGWAKVEISLAKGKKLYDKRESLKQKDYKREIKNFA